MGYRRLMIENPVSVFIKNAQLVIQKEETFSFPLEDIDAVLFENPQTKLSVTTLAKLSEFGCAVFFCDSKHMPCSILTPFMQHSRQYSVLKLQQTQTEPQKKRLWQQLVVSKITNQSRCLWLSGAIDAAETVKHMAGSVVSGDAGNAEATAAAYYFPQLFGTAFIRGDTEDGRNAALNYGYAILRGVIARTLAVYGFVPSIGVHHKSELNAFNLADDLIEPYRPLVDYYVVQNIQSSDPLTPSIKHALFDLLSNSVLIGKQKYNISYAIELTVQSLLKSMRSPETKLSLPYFLSSQRHHYE